MEHTAVVVPPLSDSREVGGGSSKPGDSPPPTGAWQPYRAIYPCTIYSVGSDRKKMQLLKWYMCTSTHIPAV